VRRDVYLQPGQHVLRPADGEIRLDELLDGRRPLLLQAVCHDAADVVISDLEQSRPAPQRERRIQCLDRLPGVSRGELMATPCQVPLESDGIDASRIDPQPVPAVPAFQAAPGIAEGAAQPGDQAPQGDVRARRGCVVPQQPPERVGRDQTVRLDDERREQHPLLAATDLDRLSRQVHLERPENPELDEVQGHRMRSLRRNPCTIPH
jgi:hypothetical protein